MVFNPQENIYLHQGDIFISDKRAVFGRNVYPVHNISSISLIRRPPDRAKGVLALIVGILLIPVDLYSYRELSFWSTMVLSIVIFILLAGGYSKITDRTRFMVVMHTSEGEIQATSSHDSESMGRVATALRLAAQGQSQSAPPPVP